MTQEISSDTARLPRVDPADETTIIAYDLDGFAVRISPMYEPRPGVVVDSRRLSLDESRALAQAVSGFVLALTQPKVEW